MPLFCATQHHDKWVEIAIESWNSLCLLWIMKPNMITLLNIRNWYWGTLKITISHNMSRTRHERDIINMTGLCLSLSDVYLSIFPLKHLAMVSVIYLSGYKKQKSLREVSHCDRSERGLDGIGKALRPNRNEWKLWNQVDLHVNLQMVTSWLFVLGQIINSSILPFSYLPDSHQD